MRIDPVTPPYTPEVERLLDRLPPEWAPPFRHYSVLARDPRLLRAYFQGSVSYIEPSHLSVRQREVFLLRVTGHCRNAFEWCLRVHYYADAAAVSEKQLHASVHGNADDPCWEPADRVVIRLADELHDTSSIGDALWSELKAVFSDEAILQLILLAGHYRTNAYLTSVLQVPVEPRVTRPFPEP
jgi:alkylhydroperoxidase family enzyme